MLRSFPSLAATQSFWTLCLLTYLIAHPSPSLDITMLMTYEHCSSLLPAKFKKKNLHQSHRSMHLLRATCRFRYLKSATVPIKNCICMTDFTTNASLEQTSTLRQIIIKDLLKVYYCSQYIPFSALTLFVGQQEDIRPVKSWYWFAGGDDLIEALQDL